MIFLALTVDVGYSARGLSSKVKFPDLVCFHPFYNSDIRFTGVAKRYTLFIIISLLLISNETGALIRGLFN